MHKFCTKCGDDIRSDQMFCIKCGTPTLKQLQSDTEMGLDNNMKGLLSLFLKPRGLDREGWQGEWSAILRMEYNEVIRGFIKDDLLTTLSTEERLISSVPMRKIKPILREHGLKVSGKKEVVVQRLIDEIPSIAEELANESEPIFICTPKGAEIAQAWKNSVTHRKQQTEEAVWQLLPQKKFNQAINLIMNYRITLPSPMSGGGLGGTSSGDYYNLRVKGIQAIKYVEGLSYKELNQAKLSATNAIIWNKSVYPGTQAFREAAEYEMGKMLMQERLKGFQISGCKKVRIIGGNDACPSCKQLHRRNYSVSGKIPVLPNKGCSHEIGWCRCFYICES